MKRCLNCLTLFDHPGWACPACGAEPCFINGFPAFAPAAAEGSVGYQPHFHGEFAALEDANFWFKTRSALIIWALSKYFPDVESFLEIGCGTGFVLSGVAANFPNASLTGAEVFSSGLPFAKTRAGRGEFVQMDARDIPYVEHFDVAGAFDVVEHIEEDERALQEIHTSLRPGGGFLLTVPQHRWLWSAQDKAACHVRRYEADELRKKVSGAGFVILDEMSFVSLLLPLMYLSRLRKRDVEACDPFVELRIHPAANQALLFVMQIEGALIRAGVRFPVGGSRLLVARKG
jgi:SAM-dependent methyltransferase